MTMAVPTVDLGAGRAAVARQIDEACRDVGFFQIVGHGIDTHVADAAWDVAHEFFALPTEAKLAVSIPEGEAYGYGPFKIERLAASLGDATPPDLKETFSVGPFDPPPPGLTDAAAAFVYSPNRWPAALPTMEPAFRAYYGAMGSLVSRLMSAMAVGLGLDPSWFDPFIDRHTSALRALHYPDLSGQQIEPGQLRAGAHTDYGTLTLLRQDDAPGGLQLRDSDEEWVDVPAVPGAFVVNVGDALQRWTNDRWRSTLHRVVVPPLDADRSCERFSMAFFHNANWDAVIECIPTCRVDGEPARHPPVTAGRHLMDKFRSTQPPEQNRSGHRSAEAARENGDQKEGDGQLVRTFKPRRRALTARRAEVFERLAPIFTLDEQGPPLDLADVFGRDGEVVLDIGFGVAEGLLGMVIAQPQLDVIGVEVHTPGIAGALAGIEEHGLTNVRLVHGDAVVFLARLHGGSLTGVRIFFPDPWPKARHQHRRLVGDDVVSRLVTLLRPAGWLHVTTDNGDYAEHIRRVCGANPGLHGGPIERPPDRPSTRYEQKAIVAGRPVTDFRYERCA